MRDAGMACSAFTCDVWPCTRCTHDSSDVMPLLTTTLLLLLLPRLLLTFHT
jgi:hypothetical protein